MSNKCIECGGHVAFSEFLNTCQICQHQKNLRDKEIEEKFKKSLRTIVNTAESVKQKHAHYYKDVSHLSQIDVYSVCRLFGVTDPAISHAVKKLLCLGQRGHKDKATDMQNVIDTLQRWQELEREFAND